MSRLLSISMTQGDVALDHNRRAYIPKNVYPELSKNNVYIKICEDLQAVFNEIFAEDVSAYNAKQTRSDRKITNYYEKIHSSEGKENAPKTCYEYVFAFGNMHDNNVSELGENESVWDSRNMLIEFVKRFEERYPNLKIISAVIHMDEQTPHLHIDIVPVATGYKKGMEHQCSLTKALENLGFVKTEKLVVENWQDDTKWLMEDIMNEYGYTREYKNNTEKHLSVDKFKLAKENERLLDEIEFNDKTNRQLIAQQETLRSENAEMQRKNDEFVQSLKPTPTKIIKTLFGEKEAEKSPEELQRDREILAAQAAQKHIKERERTAALKEQENALRSKGIQAREAELNEREAALIERKKAQDREIAVEAERRCKEQLARSEKYRAFREHKSVASRWRTKLEEIFKLAYERSRYYVNSFISGHQNNRSAAVKETFHRSE